MKDHKYHRIFSCQTLIVSQTKSLACSSQAELACEVKRYKKGIKYLSCPLRSKGCQNIGALTKEYTLAKSIIGARLLETLMRLTLDRVLGTQALS